MRALSLRQRLWAGIGGLALILALSNAAALWVLDRDQRSNAQVFHDNYGSVLYMHALSEALDAGDLATVDAEVQAELKNITEAGEKEAAAALLDAWLAYRRSRRARGDLGPPYRRMKAAAWTISDLNLKTMARLRGLEQARTQAAQRSVALLLVLGLALGALITAMTGGSILRAQRSVQLAINSLSDAVAVLDGEGQVELCNEAARRDFGLLPGAHLSSGPLAGLTAKLGPMLASGASYEPKGYAEAIQHFPHGREAFVLPRLLPVLDEKGQARGVTLVLSDVTQLRRLDEMKSNLLATVSHELKTPLTSLRMATHLLLEPKTGALNPRQRELLQTAREDGERLLAVVQDLLDQGRRAQGRDWLQFSAHAAAGLAQEAAAEAEAAFRQRGVALALRLGPELDDLPADRARLRHVFNNLLANALRYAPSGSRVDLGARRDGEGIRFWVEDQGPGIPPDQQDRVFERYYRVEGQDGSQGAGLGLAIAREIVELHGGELVLETAEKGQTRFSFWLPRKQ